MTSKLTRERIEQYANDPRMCNINDEIRQMARIALAAMDSEPAIADCDLEVYEKGVSVCLVAIPKETAEIICQNITAATGCKVDWHYFGGRVHIKALRESSQPAPVVTEVINKLLAIIDRHTVKLGWGEKPITLAELVIARDGSDELEACRAAMLNGDKS